ncbi:MULTISPECIES: hypothetical protein [unclassified Streptomyces]|uniref:hypothetical protein n=1 Tax=unclassified Streptomyces TaxID=2593676 RepID=UPI002E2D2D04|nr:hypothetical protein [Streptomyces sp. NBC_00228]
MATPTPGEPLTRKPGPEYPALALFADRAAAVLPGFSVTVDNQDAVAALCLRPAAFPSAAPWSEAVPA